MTLKLVTAPASEPLTLAEAKTHLRVDASTEDAYITALIVAAREYCEFVLNRALLAQTWVLAFDDWPARCFELPLPPLQSVTSIVYTDASGTPHTLSSSNYLVDTTSEPGRVSLKATASWPSDELAAVGAIQVTFVAGYANVGAVPESIRHAMRLMIGHLYENREQVVVGTIATSVPVGIDALLWPHRVVKF